MVASGTGYWFYQRPLPAVHADPLVLQNPTSQAIKLPWPSYGQAAFGAVGYGVLDTNNTDLPVPIASIAKTITALAILKEKPFENATSSPMITITDADVKIFNDYFAKDGSVIPVVAGSQLSEYQALLAMMLPSANNIADTAAIWAFGSVENYKTYANQLVRSLGMAQTKIADASGFSPQTKSTAKDLVILAETAMRSSVLAGIISQGEANLPGVGVVHNVNWLLKTDGVVGIKTGNTDEAGGCFLFSAKRIISGRSVTVVGAVLGGPDRNQAMTDSLKLIKAGDKGFELATPIRAKQVVGLYKLPWGGSVEAVASKDLQVLNWKGNALTPDTNLAEIKSSSNRGDQVGTIKVAASDDKELSVVLNQPLTKPSLRWRIFR